MALLQIVQRIGKRRCRVQQRQRINRREQHVLRSQRVGQLELQAIGGQSRQLPCMGLRETLDRIAELREIRVRGIAVEGDFEARYMLQALQHRQRILVGAAVVRSGERNNAQLRRHAGRISLSISFTSAAIRRTSDFVSS